MKIAYCLHGKVGNIKGKHCDNDNSDFPVLEHAHENFKKIFSKNYDVDVFIHSWSVELETQILDLYSPRVYLIEEQIDFEIPPYIRSNKKRSFAHLSRWYSFKKSIELVKPWIQEYTHVYIQRFDLIWNVIPNFKEMDPKYFWVGKSTLNSSYEWSDRWFMSNGENMLAFSTLYDCLGSYMGGLRAPLPSTTQYGGISSHRLCKFHAEQLGLIPKFKYMFGGYGAQPNEYNEIRRQVFKNDT